MAKENDVRKKNAKELKKAFQEHLRKQEEKKVYRRGK
jgi:hypothetical protein